MNWYAIPVALISLSFVSGTLVPLPSDDLTELPCGGCKANAYATLDYGNGNNWTDPQLTHTFTGGTMEITNITGADADGACHCHYERENEGSPWVLQGSCHKKSGCTASISVEATPSSHMFHVDIDGNETAQGVAATATATATNGCGDPKVTKTIKFETAAGQDRGGVTVNASCGACDTNCPAPPGGG